MENLIHDDSSVPQDINSMSSCERNYEYGLPEVFENYSSKLAAVTVAEITVWKFF